eukprot:TRINITY_DN19187_c0_g1_i1.p2 TRINITY_DN19187_c0_g1~~TRINITY_DN19187_c0_g1_i1.p2  ORF type:complete len:221 (-),score=33.00 TRINITY_DN19187_c0_g1_i1:360-1022(-)
MSSIFKAGYFKVDCSMMRKWRVHWMSVACGTMATALLASTFWRHVHIQQVKTSKIKESFLLPQVPIAKLSPMISGLLVQSELMPYIVIDLRSGLEIKCQDLPVDMQKNSVSIPASSSLWQALESKESWTEFFPSNSYPTLKHIILFVSTSEIQLKYAAAIAAGLGFQRVAVLEDEVASHCESVKVARSLKGYLNENSFSYSLADSLNQLWPHVSEDDISQ